MSSKKKRKSPWKLDKDKSDKTLNKTDRDIANTELIKLQGVHTDDNLKFTEHITKLCTKISRKVGVLSRLRNSIPFEAKLLLYKSFILPYLTYFQLSWHFLQVIGQKEARTNLYNRRLQHIRPLSYVKSQMYTSYQPSSRTVL